MRAILVLIAILGLTACDDNHFYPGPAKLIEEAPKKCLADPCLPGCPPHDFLCDDEPAP